MHTRRRASGFTLVELMIAIIVIVIAIMGLISVITFATTTNQVNRENAMAMRAAEAIVEEMRQWDVSTIFARYSPREPSDLLLLPMDLRALGPGPIQTVPGPHYPGPYFTGRFTSDPTFNVITKGGDWTGSDGKVRRFSAVVSFPTDDDPASDTDKGYMYLRERDPASESDDTISRDLNLDGDTGDDATSDYRLLPTTITIEWNGLRGVRTFTYRYMFFRRT